MQGPIENLTINFKDLKDILRKQWSFTNSDKDKMVMYAIKKKTKKLFRTILDTVTKTSDFLKRKKKKVS